MSPLTPLSRISAWQRCLLALLLLWVGALNAHLAPSEVVFIDPGVADWQVLRDGVKPGVEVVLLDAGQDGLAQMAAWAQGRSGYDAIHLLSHGSPGTVHLGVFRLNRETLGERAEELATLGAALSKDGDLLLYGCNVAAGQTGADFVQRLAQLTGADVAASEDATGAVALGGDWTLEAKLGQVDVAALSIDSYQSILPLSSVRANLYFVSSSYDAGTVDVGGGVEFHFDAGGTGNGTDINIDPVNNTLTIIFDDTTSFSLGGDIGVITLSNGTGGNFDYFASISKTSATGTGSDAVTAVIDSTDPK